MKTKTGCVIQGDIRRGTDLVISYMLRYFDEVILSTWDDDISQINTAGCVIIKNTKPEETGLNHRNYQRLSTAQGIKKAEELGCTYVLKWRTDMIPANLDIEQLIKWSEEEVLPIFNSRIVTCAYRNYTVDRDWFSSIPDLFSFGHVSIMKVLWADDGFDYTKQRNIPKEMLTDEGIGWMSEDVDGGIWCPESELYAIFKSRLLRIIGRNIGHEEIVKKYFRLIDHNKLEIVWFGRDHGFRPVFQAREHSWWTEEMWENKKAVIKGNFAYKLNGLYQYFIVKMAKLLSIPELYRQKRYLNNVMAQLKSADKK